MNLSKTYMRYDNKLGTGILKTFTLKKVTQIGWIEQLK